MNRLTLYGALISSALALPAAHAVQVEQEIVAPARQDADYFLSPAGLRMATVTLKGSRPVVLIDGTEGPLFDQMLRIDAQPFYGRRSGISTAGHLPPVIFSADGRRHAYVGRQGEELLIVVDGKEAGRLPRDTTLRNGPLSFSPLGQHFHYVLSDTTGSPQLVMNGQAGPALGGRPTAIAFSPDERRWAYAAPGRGQREATLLIVDGKEVSYAGLQSPTVYEQLDFHNDGRLVVVARTPEGAALLVDGKTVASARSIRRVHLAPQGGSIAALLVPPGETYPVLWLDGRIIADTAGVEGFLFSPDGRRHAALVHRPGSNSPQWIVSDGRKHQEYQNIRDNRDVSGKQHLRFTPDSSKLVYVGMSGGSLFVIINGEELEPGFNGLPSVFVSERGGEVAVVGRASSDSPEQRTVIVGSVRYAATRHMVHDSLTLSADGSRHYFRVTSGSASGLHVDGKPLEGFGIGTDALFSPDSRHLAFFGRRSGDRQDGLFVNGELVQPQQGGYVYLAFSPDSRHLWWFKQPSRANTFVAYLDGTAVLELDRSLPGQLDMLRQSWTLSESGALSFLAWDSGELKRYRITPAADSGVEQMLVAARQAAAAPARADSAPAPDGATAVAARLDGSWTSSQHRYGFRIQGNRGIATHSNSQHYGPGDEILRIESIDGNSFRASHLFSNGRWTAVTGELVDANTLRIRGGGANWAMQRSGD